MHSSSPLLSHKIRSAFGSLVCLLHHRYLYLIAAAVIITGCTAQYTRHILSQALADVNLAGEHQINRNVMWTVNAQTSVYLGKPVAIDAGEHGRALNVIYNELRMSLHQAFPELQTLDEDLTLAQAFLLASARGCDLLLFPKLVTLEDNLNTFQELQEGGSLHPGKVIAPDRIALQVLIYEVRTKRLIDVSTLKSHNNLFSNSEPTKLFHKAVKRYVLALSGKRTS
ncbi:MAG: hypothetical protein ACI9Y1_002392 [Lentisphaeria bacterium]|jgi:hypothetical protein